VFVHSVQHAEGKSDAIGSWDAFDPEAEAAEVAAIYPD
jgi:hypothetical protein